MANKLFSKPILLMLLSAFLLSSCASIVSKSKYPVTINSAPSEARIVIKDKKGVEVYSGQTPATIELKSGAGFFSKARYQVTFSKQGYQERTVPIESSLDGWFFGNILFGGPLGLLIIDPATGAMYKIDNQYLNESLMPLNANINSEGLTIYAYNDIPEEWKQNLIELK